MVNVLDLFLLANVFGAGSSTFIYLLVPEETCIFFFDSSCPAAAAWTRIVAAGDAAIAFVALWAKLSENCEVKLLAVWQICIYNFFHGGAYLYAHYNLHPIPQSMFFFCWSLIGSGAAAALYWGWYNPPKANVGAKRIGETTSLLED
jgi:hypothetical protein